METKFCCFCYPWESVLKETQVTFITLSSGAKLDLVTWAHFLKHYKEVTFFRLLLVQPSNYLNMQSDSSKLVVGDTFKIIGYSANTL